MSVAHKWHHVCASRVCSLFCEMKDRLQGKQNTSDLLSSRVGMPLMSSATARRPVHAAMDVINKVLDLVSPLNSSSPENNQDDDNLINTVKTEKEEYHLSRRNLGKSSDTPTSRQIIGSRRTVRQCLTFTSISDPSDVEATRVIFCGFTERDREAAIISVISSTLLYAHCSAMRFIHVMTGTTFQRHTHAFCSMINTHDELEVNLGHWARSRRT